MISPATIGWGSIAYGAALSAIAAAAAVAFAARERARPVVAVAALAAVVGPAAWNAILRAAHGAHFFVDAPIGVLPASWQDTGSGVFAVAVATLLLGFGPLRAGAGARLARVAGACGLAAFLVDVYLY